MIVVNTLKENYYMGQQIQRAGLKQEMKANKILRDELYVRIEKLEKEVKLLKEHSQQKEVDNND